MHHLIRQRSQKQGKRLLGAVLRVTSPCAMMELLGHLS